MDLNNNDTYSKNQGRSNIDKNSRFIKQTKSVHLFITMRRWTNTNFMVSQIMVDKVLNTFDNQKSAEVKMITIFYIPGKLNPLIQQ